MADLKLPNGQTIQTNDPAEIAEFIARGAETQDSALAANPGMTIQDIASRDAAAWNGPGGQGYREAMSGGSNDPTSDPSAPQKFTPGQLSGAGLDPQSYYDQWYQRHLGGGPVQDWGINDTRGDFNKQLFDYLVAKGYSPDINAFGPDRGSQAQQWLQYQPEAVRYDVQQWISKNDPGAGGGTSVGGIDFPGTYPGGSTNPGGSYEPRDYGYSVRGASPAGLAAYYQSQGMRGRPYGTAGGEHDFFPNLEYLLPRIIGMPETGT